MLRPNCSRKYSATVPSPLHTPGRLALAGGVISSPVRSVGVESVGESMRVPVRAAARTLAAEVKRPAFHLASRVRLLLDPVVETGAIASRRVFRFKLQEAVQRVAQGNDLARREQADPVAQEQARRMIFACREF